MSNFTISSQSVATQSLDSFQQGIVLPGASITRFGFHAVTMQNHSALINLGTIISATSAAIVAEAKTFTIENQGSIIGVRQAIYATPLNTTAFAQIGGTITNSGTISAIGDDGGNIHATIELLHGGNTIINSGTITNVRSEKAILINQQDTLGNHLVNSGTISGRDAGATVIEFTGAATSDRVVNTGLIIGSVEMGAGDDVFDGIGGRVTGFVYGGDGNDTYRISDPNFIAFETGGDFDRVESTVSYTLRDGIEILRLLGSSDLNGTGNGSDNHITGTNGANTLTGLFGDDSLFGRAGDDTLFGNDGADLLSGNEGNDQLFGGLGNDNLDGGQDDDLLSGGAGNDSIVGGLGNNTLFGGTGDDLLMGDAEGIDDGSGDDLMFGGAGNDLISAEEGDDLVQGGRDADTIFGGIGDDTLIGDSGNDSLGGGAGDDRLSGADGNDILFGNEDNDSLSGGLGNDSLSGDAGNDTVNGDAGADTLNGGAGNDSLFGGNDGDLLNGGNGNDTLQGGSGNDTLIGSAGQDLMSGGTGADVFVFTTVAQSATAAADTLTDFTAGSDRIDLAGIDANTGLNGNQAFAFIGSAAFSAAGQLRFVDEGANLRLLADVNGDGVADFALVLQNEPTITAASFLL